MGQPNDGKVQGGYHIYDLTIYGKHHFPMHRCYAKYIKRFLMLRQYKDSDMRYGVSSLFWDWVFV